jgi:hypothetical protein
LLPRFDVPPALPGSARGKAPSLDLTALLREVRTEVNAATREMLKNRESAMFKVKELEIEINFVVSHEAGADAAKLVPIGLESKVSSEKVQKIRLTLDPAPDLGTPMEGKEGVVTRHADVSVQ